MCTPRSGRIRGIVLSDGLDLRARRRTGILVLPWVLASCDPNAYGHFGGEKRQANGAYRKHCGCHCFLFPMTTDVWEESSYVRSPVTRCQHTAAGKEWRLISRSRIEYQHMKTIGLLGGMSWESTIPYYRIVNQTVKEKLGALHSAKIALYSVDFFEVERMQSTGDWDSAGQLLGEAAQRLQAAGADFIVLCTNTMHKVAPAIEAAVSIPLLHIADPTASAIKAAGFRTVGLLGTKFTMEQTFYKDRLKDHHGLDVLVPTEEERNTVHRVIYEELCLGQILPESRDAYRVIIAKLVARGAQAIILGCTEISLLVTQSDSEVPLFDTTYLHAQSAAEFALL